MPVIEDNTLPTEPIEIDLDQDMPDVEPLAAEPRAPAPPEPPQPEEESPLQKALDAQRRAEDLQRAAQRERDEAVRHARARGEELTRERSRSEDAEYNSVLTAIAAEQSALDKAEADYVSALNAQDFTAAAKAQTVMARSTGRIDRLEENKQVFDQRRAAPPRPEPQPQPRAPQPQGFEAQIANLPEPAKVWLRKHPEFVNDTALNEKIGGMHVYLTKSEGVEAFSPAYFDALDTRFGFKAKPEQPRSEPQQRRSMPMSAPVSRDVPGSNGQRQDSKKMYLTPEEVQVARLSIVDRPDMPKLTNSQKEYIYAQNKQKLKNQRASGEYRQTTEQNG